MKNILLPTDYSENSLNAIRYAISFFRKTRCNFFLFNAVPISTLISGDMVYAANTIQLEKTITESAKLKMKNLVKRIEKEDYNPKHNFVSLVEYDHLVSGIKHMVADKNIDLIVMGTKGASGLKEVVLGSNTGSVITRVQSNVLVIPEEAKFIPPEEIAFATDYNLLYNAKILDPLIEIAKKNEAMIRVLHVSRRDEVLSQEQKENKELLGEYLKDIDHHFHSVTNKKLEAAVECFVQSREVQMIAMIAKNLNFFQQILFKPTIEEISYHTKVPFLVLHE